ncbi:MAG: STAS domain-containing protein [Pirellulales bacterium]|nr:STAS domain-containing protein [Pirellulales bacterium]
MTQQTRQGDVTVFQLDREYDALDVARFEPFAAELLAAAKSANPPLLVLDFGHTAYIGSSFIEMLVRAWKRLNERGGRMALCGVAGFCQDVLRATQLDTLWPICDDRDAAVALLQEPAS